MEKTRKIILLGDDLKKPIRLAAEKGEKLSVTAVLFDRENADIRIDLREKGGAVNFLIIHISGDGAAKIEAQVEHTAKETTSDFKVRSILSGKAKTDFHGLVGIRKSSDDSAAKLFAEAMLFGDRSGIDFVPSMEVETKNVTASHGATIETIDPEKCFYLGSRGLTEAEIRHTLAESFISPVNETAGEETAIMISNKIKAII